jgi:hypothetical protein
MVPTKLIEVAEKVKRSAIGEAISPKAYPVPEDNDLRVH